MKISKNLSMTITDESQGTNLSFKTIDTFDDHIAIIGDLGAYPIQSIESCLTELKQFIESRKTKPNAS